MDTINSTDKKRIHVEPIYVLAATIVVITLLTSGIIGGIPPRHGSDYRSWVPKLCQTVGFDPFAELDDKSLSKRPDYWWTENEGNLIPTGADLSDRNLQGCSATRAYFKNANLRNANLSYADLSGADLRIALLTGANLSNANLKNCRLDDADLSDANLTKTDLRGVDLTRVKGLTLQAVSMAITDSLTKLPDYID